MNEYDSILKEKKKKQIVVEEKQKKFPIFSVSFILIILILIISYLFYYNNILNSREIFINNIKTELNNYNILFENIPLKEFIKEKNMVGSIEYKEEIFNFNFIKNKNNLNFNISNKDKYYNYFLIDNEEYVNINNANSNIKVNYNDIIKSSINIYNKFLSIKQEQYIKTFYIDGIKPIVEVNLVMDTSYINELLNLNLTDEYQVIITMKNNAIMNTIENIKIVINNISKNDRRVVFITNNQITYKTKNNEYNLVLEKNNNDFNIKINKNDNPYITLTGTTIDNIYTYNYKNINKNYNLDIKVLNNKDTYNYEIINRSIEEEKIVNINLTPSTGYTIDSQYDTFTNKNDEGIKEIYTQEFGYFKDKLLEFIK